MNLHRNNAAGVVIVGALWSVDSVEGGFIFDVSSRIAGYFMRKRCLALSVKGTPKALRF